MSEQDSISTKTLETADEYLICRVCGRKVASELCSWDEDAEGMYCLDCRAEVESCGCSDQ